MENQQNDQLPEFPKAFRLDGGDITPLEKEKTTNANTWLKMDLEMQSGSIWTDFKDGENDDAEKENPDVFYKMPIDKTLILDGDPMVYNGKIIPDNTTYLDD